MSLLTNWGYTLTDIDSLPDFLDIDEFNTFTGGKYRQAEDKVEAEISAACAAIRNYIGWHLFPSAACELKTTFFSRRITFVGCDILIQLPSKYVTGITSVHIGGVEYDTYVLETNGILHVYGVHQHLQRYSEVKVEYTAGVPDAMLGPIRELVAHRVTHSVAVPSGITQESSGGVSVTYNTNWINSARATALPDDNKEVLAPYRVQGVF